MANQWYEIARRLPAAAPYAVKALEAAVATDPGSAVLVSKLLIAQRAIGQCDKAAFTARLLGAVSKTEKARALIKKECG